MSPNKVRCWSKGGPNNEVWNWGDAISPEIVKYVSGKTPEVIDYTTLTSDPHIMVCGSTLKWTTRGSILWGVGEIAENIGFVQGNTRPLHVAAVRGPMTRDKLIKAGIECPEVFCDPAHVFPTYYRPKISSKRYRLGIIPHYIDATLPTFLPFRDREDVHILDITQADVSGDERIFSFVDQVCACDAIISSSLHGIIIADAYGIPSKWMQVSDKVFGKGFKFRDYFFGINQAQRADNPLTNLPSVDKIAELVLTDFAKHGLVRANVRGFIGAFDAIKFYQA
ncbi:MAG TPA: polysaccharide pyruvyl transferase family protein [Hyphomicrobium sp.]|nr:polysaccharide pyruvyl transferase family protein [Hyphomicrobium sp.]